MMADNYIVGSSCWWNRFFWSIGQLVPTMNVGICDQLVSWEKPGVSQKIGQEVKFIC